MRPSKLHSLHDDSQSGEQEAVLHSSDDVYKRRRRQWSPPSLRDTASGAVHIFALCRTRSLLPKQGISPIEEVINFRRCRSDNFKRPQMA
mmetsp:Transcript_53170/g.142171  ORF Transcript_53170/g.142171 Transcript_53170/m.142171 type:complete len:90 (-) Transcript_53170:3-272(-)